MWSRMMTIGDDYDTLVDCDPALCCHIAPEEERLHCCPLSSAETGTAAQQVRGRHVAGHFRRHAGRQHFWLWLSLGPGGVSLRAAGLQWHFMHFIKDAGTYKFVKKVIAVIESYIQPMTKHGTFGDGIAFSAAARRYGRQSSYSCPCGM